MDVAIGTVSCGLRFDTPQEACARAAEMGLNHIEWFGWGRKAFPITGADMTLAAELSAASGVGNAYHAPNWGEWDLGLAGDGAAQVLRRILDHAEKLTARHVTLHMGNYDPAAGRDAGLRHVVVALAEVAPEAEGRGVTFGVENFIHFTDYDLATQTEDFQRLFDAVGSPAVGLTLDVGHANITGTMNELLDRFGSRMVHMHVHDNTGDDGDRHLAPGQGTVDWDFLCARLVQMRYAGTISLEFNEKHEDLGEAADKLRRKLRQAAGN